jgi:hypothetical protein
VATLCHQERRHIEMNPRRSASLRRINIVIGAVLLVTGISGGFLLTFWFLIVLLPVTCVGASWMMASTVRPGQEGHVIGAVLLTALFLAWLCYFLQNGVKMPTWYGLLAMSALMIIQAAIHVSTRPRQPERVDIDRAN